MDEMGHTVTKRRETTMELKLVRLVALVVALIVVATFGSCVEKDYQIRKMVEAGVSPIEAKCAVSSNVPDLCRMLVVKSAGEN